jgi:hypothetical protein
MVSVTDTVERAMKRRSTKGGELHRDKEARKEHRSALFFFFILDVSS